MTDFYSQELCRWVAWREEAELKEAGMKESFIAWQKRARELEKRLRKIPDNADNRALRGRVLKEWREPKERMAQALIDEGGLK